MKQYAVLLLINAMLLASTASAKLPDRAHRYLPMLKEEALLYNSPVSVSVLAGLIEMETCVTRTSKKCWNPKATYSTRREKGRGLGMLTIAYDRKGHVRFNALRSLKRRHPTLRRLTWNNIKHNPRLQMRALILTIKDIWNSIKGNVPYRDRLAMTISAYNQGQGGLRRDRRICKARRGCDSTRWYGHVRTVKRKGFSTRKLSGTRHTPWTINRRHVKKTLRKARTYTGGRILKTTKPKLMKTTHTPRKQYPTPILQANAYEWTPDQLRTISELLG